MYMLAEYVFIPLVIIQVCNFLKYVCMHLNLECLIFCLNYFTKHISWENELIYGYKRSYLFSKVANQENIIIAPAQNRTS